MRAAGDGELLPFGRVLRRDDLGGLLLAARDLRRGWVNVCECQLPGPDGGLLHAGFGRDCQLFSADEGGVLHGSWRLSGGWFHVLGFDVRRRGLLHHGL